MRRVRRRATEVTDPEGQKNVDRLDRTGEDPAAESGAGYGSHAPGAEPEDSEDTPEAHPS